MKKLLSFLFVLLLTYSVSAQVIKTQAVTTPGTLATLASAYLTTVTNLTLTGNIDARDVFTIRDAMPALAVLDLSGVSIKAYNGNDANGNYIYGSANQLPNNSFYYSTMMNVVGKTTLNSIVLPTTLTSIGDYAFSNRTGLSAITIPSGVTSIGNYVFIGCTGLTSITIPAGVTFIGSGTFQGCTGLTSFTIPARVTSIGSNAFQSCTGLTSITIGTGVTSIGSSAFYGCTGLTSITIPAGVSSIGSSAFYGCTGITSFVVDNSNLTYASQAGLLLNKAKTSLMLCPTGLSAITIPAGITAIGSNAFSGCISALKITCLATTPPTGTFTSMGLANALVYVPTGTSATYTGAWGTSTTSNIIEQDVDVTVNVTEAGKLATTIFNQLNAHPGTVTKLTVTGTLNSADILYIRDNMKQCYDVNLKGVSLTDLPTDAFNGRGFLFSIKLPSNLKTIGSNAFYGCSNIQTMNLPAGVTSIGTSAFQNCSGLDSINIPTSVTSIKNGAFSSCTSLKTLSITGATSIEYGAFNSCIGLTSVSISGATSIGYSAFQYCSGLTSVSISGTTSIQGCAFQYCSGLKTLSITGATSIEYGVFNSCIGLTSVSISGATSIGSSAFQSCSSLTSIDIPGSVTSIGDYAFQSCSGLTSISIGAKAASIGANAFDGCSKVSSITSYRLTPPALGTGAMNGINPQTCKLRILQEADFDAYFSAAQWGSFLTVERIDLSGLLGDSNEDSVINILDVVNIVNYILEKPVVKFNILYSDINKDGDINVIDVVQLVKQISSAPAGAPAFKAKADVRNNTAYWNVEQGIFSTYMPGGLRGFDITYTGTLSNLPALDGFVTSAYIKNGVQHLLGYSLANVIAAQEFTQLFQLNESATINDMIFVNDNGTQVMIVKGTATDLQSLDVKGSVVIKNGQLRWTSADELLSLTLYNSNGSLVSTSVTSTLLLPENAKGVYILQAKTKQGNMSRKIVL